MGKFYASPRWKGENEEKAEEEEEEEEEEKEEKEEKENVGIFSPNLAFFGDQKNRERELNFNFF